MHFYVDKVACGIFSKCCKCAVVDCMAASISVELADWSDHQWLSTLWMIYLKAVFVKVIIRAPYEYSIYSQLSKMFLFFAKCRVALKRAVFPRKRSLTWLTRHLSTLTTDTAGQLDVLWHDRHTLGVDGTQVGVLEETDEVSLAGFLESHDSWALETQVGLEVLCDLTNQTLEWQLADQELGRFLVTTDLTKSNGSWPVTMRFLHSTGGWCTLAGCLGCKLLPWRLSSCRLTSGLLCTSHDI